MMQRSHSEPKLKAVAEAVLKVINTDSDTVNSEIFARVLFSRNFAYAKFRENKILAKWRNHSVNY